MNTHRFVEKLGVPARRIPIFSDEEMPAVREPYLLVVPTYADGEGRGAVHKQIIRFLNDERNRSFIRGVIGSGNRNFGRFYGYAGDVISARCKVPYLHKFELAGTEDDVAIVKNRMEQICK